jgi:hypothetical protein
MRFTSATAVALAVSLMAASCATNGARPGEADSAQIDAPRELTMAKQDEPLAEVIRQAGELAVGRYALMHGLGPMQVDSASFVRARPAEVAESLAEDLGLAVQKTDHYDFIYAPGYEALTQVNLGPDIPARFAETENRIAIGDGMPLYAALAMISQALGKTIVADNAAAAARSGEIALTNAPLYAAVEAMLKSARATRFFVDATDEYLFIQAVMNRSERSSLLNEGDLDQRQLDYLEQETTVYLPAPPTPDSGGALAREARTLAYTLPHLSRQLGIQVVAERGLADLPVNPAVLANVRVRTALNLLVRQWLQPDYGWHFAGDRIVIRKRQAHEQVVGPASEASPAP